MTRIPVEKVHGSDTSRIAEDTQTLAEQIRQLAFHLFEARGYSDGHDLEDWLSAERELVVKSEPEVTERNGRYEIRMPVPGFDEAEVHVTALPGSLVVNAAAKNSPRGGGNKRLLRTIDLPDQIDVDKTVARVDKGVVYVTAVRQHAPALA